ncbi:MAG: translation initiation factor IF-3 [Oscillospiraceae bacterium]|nr:translation initiation factor IF-3 [Oscillospiraceae bacterium]
MFSRFLFCVVTKLTGIHGRCFTIAKKEQLINEEIREKEVRVVSENGEQMGIMATSRALGIAMERNLDLVLIAPQGVPPVCRIMDFGKHKFEQAKRDKEAKKNQKIVETKEIRLSLNIDQHDLEVKLKNAIKFLQAGDKVKVSIRFRGRQIAHQDMGVALMTRVGEELAEHGAVEKLPKVEGRSMIMFISAKKTAPPVK